jgi:hypothetical protein
MKLSRRPIILNENEELFERRFAWIISKVLSGATLFFILAVAAQWGSFREASSSHVKVRTAHPVITSNVRTVAFATTKKDSGGVTATTTM